MNDFFAQFKKILLMDIAGATRLQCQKGTQQVIGILEKFCVYLRKCDEANVNEGFQ